MERSPGIFLHKIRYRDNSVVAHILMPDGSLRPFMVHGVQGGRKAKAALLTPLQELELVFRPQENRDLITLRELHCPEPLRYIPAQGPSLFQAQFMAELLYKCLRSEPVHHTGLYAWLMQRIAELDTPDPPWWVALRTAATLPELLGFEADAQWGVQDPQSRFNFAEGGFDPAEYPLSGRAQGEQGYGGSRAKSRGSDLAGEELSRHLAQMWTTPPEEWEAQGLRKNQAALLRALCHYLKTHVQQLSPIRSLDVFLEMGA